MKNPPSALDVAVYILQRRGKLPVLKLQRLVYYAQVWSLVWEGTPLFAEPIEAWMSGPAIRTLYEQHGLAFALETCDGYPNRLSAEHCRIVDTVLHAYASKGRRWLGALAQMERPWRDARKGLKRRETSTRKLSHASLIAYYASLRVPIPSNSRPVHALARPVRTQEPYNVYVPNENLYHWMQSNPSWEEGAYGWNGSHERQKPTKQISLSTRAMALRKKLTRDEVLVVRGIARGLTQREIAEQLNLSARSLREILATLRGKLGTRTMADVVESAYSLGIVQRVVMKPVQSVLAIEKPRNEQADVKPTRMSCTGSKTRVPLQPLTSYEKQILRLFAQGKNRSVIAQALNKSAYSVMGTMARIRRKLSVLDDIGLLSRALEVGVLSERDTVVTQMFTQAEHNVIGEIARGFTMDETAQRLQRSRAAVVSLLNSVRSKLRVKTTEAAVDRVRQLGFASSRRRCVPLTTAAKLRDDPNAAMYLTHRQRDILALLAQGIAPRSKIATHMGISTGSLSGYITKLRWRLGAERPSHIVLKARELGLIPASAPLSATENPIPAKRWLPILRLAAQGYCSQRELRSRCNLSHFVIYKYMKEIRDFFGASNLAHAITIARRKNLLDF